MSNFYNRVWSLEIDGKDFILETTERQFRVVFQILHDYGGYTSYADIQIYGLSRETEAKVFKTGQKISFRCGYEDNVDYIFKGDLVNLIRDKRGSDRFARLICRSGAQARDNSSIYKTLGTGTVLPDVIKACADAMGLSLVINANDFSAARPFARGRALNGSPDEYLKKLAKENGFNYVIENEKIIVSGLDSYREGSVTQVSQFTGMVGQPEITEEGADVLVKMNPKVKIFGRFQISSEYKTFNFNNIYYQNVKPSDGLGVYKILRIEHSGDSYGDDWNTKITGVIPR